MNRAVGLVSGDDSAVIKAKRVSAAINPARRVLVRLGHREILLTTKLWKSCLKRTKNKADCFDVCEKRALG